MIDSENFISYLKKRDVTALDYVIDIYSKKIFGVAYRILNNSELSEECLNDVLLKIWDNIKYFNRENEKFYENSKNIDILNRHVSSLESAIASIDSKKREVEKTQMANIDSLKKLKIAIFNTWQQNFFFPKNSVLRNGGSGQS